MRLPHSTSAVLVAATLLVGGSTAQPRAQAHLDVSLTIFHDRLANDGDWVVSARYGDVWMPRHVHSTWRPYASGYWTYTDVGWTWVTDEPWGWATYHYGRWAFDPTLGWIWVPDAVWGPSWVAWRYNDQYTGWAPLPPGVVVTADFDPPIDSFAYVFVATPHLCDRNLVTYIEPPARNVTFVRLTANDTHFAFTGGVTINRGAPIDRVEHVIGHAVPRYTVAATTAVGPARVSGGHVEVYRPSTVLVTQGHAVPAARPAPAARVETPAQIDARQAQERKAFDADQAKARQQLEARHKTELAHPPVGMTRDAVVARQEAEHKAQAENEARQRQVMDARHQAEQHPPNNGRGRGRGERL